MWCVAGVCGHWGHMLSAWLRSLLMTHHVDSLGCIVHNCWPASMHVYQPNMPVCLYVCACVVLVVVLKKNILALRKSIVACIWVCSMDGLQRGFILIWPQWAAALFQEESCHASWQHVTPTNMAVSCDLVKLIMLKINCPRGEKPVRLPVISLVSQSRASVTTATEKGQLGWNSNRKRSSHISTFSLLVYLISSDLLLLCSHAPKLLS